MNTENIIKEILTGIEDAFNELDLPKKPYGRNELWEGITNYFKIKQLRDFIIVITTTLRSISPSQDFTKSLRKPWKILSFLL